MRKDIDKYLVIRHQMQRFKSYFADPPKKKKFKKTKLHLPPINQPKNMENNVIEDSVEKNEIIDGMNSIINNTTIEEKKIEDQNINKEASNLNTQENNNDKNKPGT